MKAYQKTRRFAALDLGTNTTLLIIAEIRERGNFIVLDDQARITRLGEGVDRAGILSENAQRRTLAAIKDYAARCQELAVDEVVVVATSALRDAANRAEFTKRLEQQSGLQLRILSGEEEARYSFEAVCGGLDLQGKKVLAVDVGGGSTELIWGRDGKVDYWTSLQLGSVRLTERYLVSDPTTEQECIQVRLCIDQELGQRRDAFPFTKPQVTVGIAGTFTTLAAITRGLTTYSHSEVHGSRLARAEVKRQIGLFKEKTISERKQITGLDPGRADVILAGALLIDRVMAFFEIKEVWVSDQGVRYGVLYEMVKLRFPKAGAETAIQGQGIR
jgi:exopolyphosphatase/guanosine-5'-triphosphate,3'-diphosphate pyrophosphatase